MSHYIAYMLSSVARGVHAAYANVSDLHRLQVSHLHISAALVPFDKSIASHYCESPASLFFPLFVGALMIAVMMCSEYVSQLCPLGLLYFFNHFSRGLIVP